MTDLTRIPPEVWTVILTFACTDGGSTGRSLALTSHFFSSQSLSARFHTLSLTSLDQLECFLAFLRTQPDGFKPRVEHLFLSIPSPPHGPQRAALKGLSRQERDDLYEAYEERNGTWDNRVHAAMSSLLLLVSSTLRTLSLIMAKPQPPVPVDAFPVLEEFSVCGEIAVFLKAPAEENHLSTTTPAHGWSRFPALRRLHYYAGHGSSLAVTPTLIGGSPPPLLTHLCFSNLKLGDDDLDLLPKFDRILGFPELECGIRVSAVPDRSKQDTSFLKLRLSAPCLKPKLPHLQHIVVHCPLSSRGWRGTPYHVWRRMFSEVEAFAAQCEDETDIRMVAMSRSRRRNLRWKDRLHDDWLDRIGGGRGCWVHTVDEEAELEMNEDTSSAPNLIDASKPY